MRFLRASQKEYDRPDDLTYAMKYHTTKPRNIQYEFDVIIGNRRIS